jgi:hypothetical protein
MCLAASAAALSLFPPLAAFSASIAAFNSCQALSWGGMNTFAFFGFLDAADFPAGRFGRVNSAAAGPSFSYAA